MKNKIKQIRIRKKITQKQLETATGIKQAELSKLENNKRNPSINILERVAKGLNCKVSELLEE